MPRDSEQGQSPGQLQRLSPMQMQYVRLFQNKRTLGFRAQICSEKKKGCTSGQVHAPTNHNILSVFSHTHTVVPGLAFACGPVVFELPLRLQSVQIHSERRSSLPASTTAAQREEETHRQTRSSCTNKDGKHAENRSTLALACRSSGEVSTCTQTSCCLL